jgi:hypothetical protein
VRRTDLVKVVQPANVLQVSLHPRSVTPIHSVLLAEPNKIWRHLQRGQRSPTLQFIVRVRRNLTNYQLNPKFQPLFGEDARSDRISIEFRSRQGQIEINFDISCPRSADSGSRHGRPAEQERLGLRPSKSGWALGRQAARYPRS